MLKDGDRFIKLIRLRGMLGSGKLLLKGTVLYSLNIQEFINANQN